MKNFFNWLITSSADPSKVSLTVKAALVAIAPIAIYFLQIDQIQFGELMDGIVNVVYAGTALVSAIGIVVGLIRKLAHGRWSAGAGER